MGVNSLQTKILRKKTIPEEYQIYRAALEWDLTDPIVIENADDFKSTRQWQDRLEPYHHQVTNLITFCRRLPVTLLADDVGLGKTISAGLIMSELVARSRLSKILIVCPKLLGPQWQAELKEKFGITAEIAIGRDLLDADPEGVGAVITTYNTARLYLDRLPEDRFQMLILDEAHKLRNLYGTNNAPQVAKKFHKALEDRRFTFVLMLTATPIQNRLWDLYSLVDLLTVARGHENPFGSPGLFARRFIADKRDQARQLKPEAKDEFRSIVYGYMSRVRRGDANLLFPERVVQMHQIDPTASELQLINTIAGPIQKLNRLTQISILQALTSSPEALMAQLLNMARNRTVPRELAEDVKAIVTNMPQSAKLHGLERLIEKLKKENLDSWRLVIFTCRRETQTTIQTFLEGHGFKVGIINGDSGQRNQETIARFKKDPPDLRVIVSTEAGSEGVNLQVANVLVNYDLPWNPMIVEQRIGRVQRLASNHANVSIFNVMLRGTFEEYIVGRLMEKLQMASHAIGDIEALLQGSVGDGDENNFEDKILDLVLSALAGKDFEKDTQLIIQSIENAKKTFEKEEENINALLGSMDGMGYVGPRAPSLPNVSRSMEASDFTLGALKMLGVRLSLDSAGWYIDGENNHREYIRFEASAPPNIRSTLYAPGSAAFQRLISRMIATGIHEVDDADNNPIGESEKIARRWVEDFGGKPKTVEPNGASRCFEGKALLRTRAIVAHDSYERLIDVPCFPTDHRKSNGRAGLAPLGKVIDDPETLGIDADKLLEAAGLDEGIAEFSRFYLERREQEIKAAGDDERKRKKLYDEFTPNITAMLAGLEGKVSREIKMRVRYSFDTEDEYESQITVLPHRSGIVDLPDFSDCAKSKKEVPVTCLATCSVTGENVLRHLLVKSEISDRHALPEYCVICALSGKRVLQDEAEKSAVTGRLIAKTLLRVSALSGKSAEPEYFGECAFTKAEILKTELATSEISGLPYRIDEQARSVISGKTGHQQEFITCHETRQTISLEEAETCEVTGKQVRPGILAVCEETGKRVIPSEIERCSVTGKKVLKSLLVKSSLSDARLLPDAAIRSLAGQCCTPAEARACIWSGKKFHPDDLRVCSLTGLTIHSEYTLADNPPRLAPLAESLAGMIHATDKSDMWPVIERGIVGVMKGGKCQIEAAVISPSAKHITGSAQLRTLLGLRVQQIGFVYSLSDGAIIGRLAKGKRGKNGWIQAGK